MTAGTRGEKSFGGHTPPLQPSFTARLQLVDLPMQGPPADPKLFSGLRDISIRGREGLHDEALLGFVEIKRAGFLAECFRWSNPGRQAGPGGCSDILRQVAQG